MRAYYHDNLPGDPRLPHDHIPSKPVSTDRLKKLGVLHLIVPVEGHEPKINAIAEERGYKNRDTIELSQEGPREVYEDKIRTLYQEHLHEDDEIRYVLSGGGFFDVREASSDAWIRLALEPGDLLIVPAGLYHRFTLNDSNNLRALRLFQDEPKWICYNRSVETDANPCRVEYLKIIASQA